LVTELESDLTAVYGVSAKDPEFKLTDLCTAVGMPDSNDGENNASVACIFPLSASCCAITLQKTSDKIGSDLTDKLSAESEGIGPVTHDTTVITGAKTSITGNIPASSVSTLSAEGPMGSDDSCCSLAVAVSTFISKAEDSVKAL